jgi:beta-glucosidase-like glycosyl hydrolase
VWDLVSRINATDKANLLTARGFRSHGKGTDAKSSGYGGRQALPALGVPSFYWGSNCIHSSMFSNCTKSGKCSTSFPSNVNFASSFDPKLMRDMAGIIGKETRAGWNEGDWLDNGYNGAGLECWGPVLNIARDPRWGRNGEGGTEDPYLNGRLGVAWTVGLQKGTREDEEDSDASPYVLVAATLKHFDANSLESSGGFTRHTVDAQIPIQQLTDFYWPAFRAAIVEADAKGVMCSYNSVNGVPTCASATMKSARDRWGFSGYVTSDSDSVADVVHSHNYTATPEEAACVSIAVGGTDIDSGNTYYNFLLKGVNASRANSSARFACTMQDVDRALFNSLRVRFELGLFDARDVENNKWWALSAEKDIGTAAGAALNRRAAAESLVLLQNPRRSAAPASAVLPLARGQRIAVIGPHGNATRALIQVDTGMICPDNGFGCVTSPFAAIARLNREGGARGVTTFDEGCDVVLSSTEGFAAALASAEAADVVVLGLGITSCGAWHDPPAGELPAHLKDCARANATNGMQWIEAEGHDRTSIDLPSVQRALAAAVLALNKPTAVFLLNGGMVAVEEEMSHANTPAMVEAFYPGAEGGEAIADALFGVTNTFGKMPYTVYSAGWAATHDMVDHDVQHGDGRTYRYLDPAKVDVLFPFGHGLSYTTFALALAPPTKKTITIATDGSSETITIAILLSNVGGTDGDEVVIAYFAPTQLAPPGVPNAPRRVVWSFQRASVAAGARTELVFPLSIRDLQLADVNGDTVAAPGTYELTFTAGGATNLSTTVHVTGSKVVLEPYAGAAIASASATPPPPPPPCSTGIPSAAPWIDCELAVEPRYGPLPATSVNFTTSDAKLQALFDHAEVCEAHNTLTLGPGFDVVVEGGHYNAVWLETQPMGGAMYGVRNLTLALNNQLIFLRTQRSDGRLAGMVTPLKNASMFPAGAGVVRPTYSYPGDAQHSMLQGFYMASPAVDVAWLMNRTDDAEATRNVAAYIAELKRGLERFEAWLWRARNSSHGVLWLNDTADTGEDGSDKFRGMTPPFESMDMMGYAHDAQRALARIAAIEGDDATRALYAAKMARTAASMKARLWREERAACFDRERDVDDARGFVTTLVHNNLRAMWHGVFDEAMADAFVATHLMNRSEFWTPTPLPSIAASDARFENEEGNNWSGPPEGLTFQRAIRALESYGHHAEVIMAGALQKDALLRRTPATFPQQIDPFTSLPDKGDCYGPMLLSQLEFSALTTGVAIRPGAARANATVWWSNIAASTSEHASEHASEQAQTPRATAPAFTFTQRLGASAYRVEGFGNGTFHGSLNGKRLFACDGHVRVVSSADGVVSGVVGAGAESASVVLTLPQRAAARFDVAPNEEWLISSVGAPVRIRRVAFTPPFV